MNVHVDKTVQWHMEDETQKRTKLFYREKCSVMFLFGERAAWCGEVDLLTAQGRWEAEHGLAPSHSAGSRRAQPFVPHHSFTS